MSKTITITESQLAELKKKIDEQGNEITVDAQPDANGTVSTTGLKTQYNNVVSKVGNGTNVKLSVDGADLTECKCFTKKQIKEAKLANLKKNCTVFKKGDIR